MGSRTSSNNTNTNSDGAGKKTLDGKTTYEKERQYRGVKLTGVPPDTVEDDLRAQLELGGAVKTLEKGARNSGVWFLMYESDIEEAILLNAGTFDFGTPPVEVAVERLTCK